MRLQTTYPYYGHTPTDANRRQFRAWTDSAASSGLYQHPQPPRSISILRSCLSRLLGSTLLSILFLYLYLYSPSLLANTKMAPVERITLFNIPSEADQNRVLEQYKVLAQTARKVRMPLNPFPDAPG